VIHTVGPFWSGGRRHEDQLLASCYRRSLEVAGENGVSSIAFPAISTGAYRFPPERAAGIAVQTVSEHGGGFDVTFCCFSEASAELHRQALERVQ
jgi:O-acetyl-ADP-ribose deacetylase (regulator of RNase III)